MSLSVRLPAKPMNKSVKHIATALPAPSLSTRRYQPWHLIADPGERKLAVVRLHSEGWSIAQYLQTTRPTIYATLERWTEEGVAGLEPKSRARKGPRKVTLKVTNEVRKLQENPLLGKWRIHTALLRLRIEVSPATCARIMNGVAPRFTPTRTAQAKDQPLGIFDCAISLPRDGRSEV